MVSPLFNVTFGTFDAIVHFLAFYFNFMFKYAVDYSSDAQQTRFTYKTLKLMCWYCYFASNSGQTVTDSYEHFLIRIYIIKSELYKPIHNNNNNKYNDDNNDHCARLILYKMVIHTYVYVSIYILGLYLCR